MPASTITALMKWTAGAQFAFTNRGSLASMGRKAATVSQPINSANECRRLFLRSRRYHPGAGKRCAQIGKNDHGEGIHLRFQNRRERARPNHFHGHRHKTGRKQNPFDEPAAGIARRGRVAWPAERSASVKVMAAKPRCFQPRPPPMRVMVKLPAAATQSVWRNPNSSTRTTAVKKVPLIAPSTLAR
jgi:hypothetical protein